MTWLSRLLPQSRGIQRVVDRSRPARPGRRQRRMSTLELLEDRIVLSNIVVSQNPVTDVVSITGDGHGDSFSVTIDSASKVTVVGTGSTQVNSHPVGVAWTSPVGALGLTTTLSGTGTVQDKMSLTGPATTTQLKSVAINVIGTERLTFTADSVRLSSGPGSFTLNDGTATKAGGQLSAIITNSQFSSLSIYQTGCCPAYVELDNDRVSGAVSVTEGVANGDGIVVDNGGNGLSNFGSTTFVQYAGPTQANCNGTGDFIRIDNANLKDLTIHQYGPGGNNSIVVGLIAEVEVSALSFGIYTTQASGNNDLTELVSITTSGKPSNSPHGGPDSIYVVQGDGNNDSVIIDTAQVWGDVTVYQGNGALDSVAIQGVIAGWTLATGPAIYDFYGDLTVVQGNGGNDVVTLAASSIETTGIRNSFNNVYIFQGNGDVLTTDCTPGVGDTVNIDSTDIVSDLVIYQGAFEDEDENTTDLGNNVINIATIDTVVVGDSTVIWEVGENNGNNLITLGGIGGPDSGSVDFETGYLDVWTGDAGGAFVQVYNTLVDYGLNGYFSWANIDGGGDGNTSIIDEFSAQTVTSAF
jgi:hypothetical protein